MYPLNKDESNFSFTKKLIIKSRIKIVVPIRKLIHYFDYFNTLSARAIEKTLLEQTKKSSIKR